MFYFDPIYYIIVLPGLFLSIIAQIWIQSSFKKYSQENTGNPLTGLDIANLLVERENLPVDINVRGNVLSDNFDPSSNTVNISTSSARNASVADVAVVAHEFGHVQQKYHRSALFMLRTILVPVVNIGTNLGYILFLAGLFLNLLNLSEVGLILFASSTLFALITVPVEIDASKKGLQFIRKYKLIEQDKIGGAKQVLSAAALTYIAALVSSFLNLLYFGSVLSRRKD